jgi:hypothetical protein
VISATPAYLAANTKPGKKPIFVVTIEGYSRSFSNRASIGATTAVPTTGGAGTLVPWLVEGGMEDMQVTVNDLAGSSDLADLIFTVQDRGALITADFPNFVFEGKTAQLLAGYEGLDISDFVTLATAKIDSVESTNSNQDYVFSCPDIRADMAQTIYAVGDDGAATSSDHPKTLNGHPLDILLATLETECGYLTSQIDVARITTYRDGLYSGAQMQFTLTSPVTASEFIEKEIMIPLGAYHRTNNLGQITVEFAYPLNDTTVFDFNPSNLVEIPEAGQADLVNQVLTKMDADDTDFAVSWLSEYQPSITKYGLFGQQTIESKGLRSGLNGIFLASITAFLIFLRYGLKALCHGDNGKNTSSNPVNAQWTAALVEPGDFVTLTHPKVPDRTLGVIGITAKPYVVMDRNWQFFAGQVQYKLVEIDFSKFKQYLITANGEADYLAASSADQSSLMFLCNDSDQYSNGNPANTLS